MDSPFKGLKVIELSSVLAGPAVGMFFAELGAEVIKVENPKTGGDVTRQWKFPSEKADELSAYYTSVNWGKHVQFLDITAEQHLSHLFYLLEEADILLVNFKAGDAEKYNLDYKKLSVRYPKLICGYLTGYSETDPRPAFDLVMQAETGFMSMNGTAESGPLKMPVAIIDLMAAHQLKEGLLTALFLRERSGKGSSVCVSLFDAAIASLANQASNYLVTAVEPALNGSLHPNIAPYGETFLCGDGRYIVLAIGNDSQFHRFSIAIGKPELITDPRFGSNQQRVMFRQELPAFISPFFMKRTITDAAAILTSAQVPFAIIRTVGEALSSHGSSHLILDGKAVKTAVFRIEC